MKPRVQLAETTTPDGGRLVLGEQDGAFSISFAGQELMHSRAQASEILLGQIGLAHLTSGSPGKVMIGGLGLGFTLKSAVAIAGSAVLIEVVELVPAVIEWNQTFLAELNDHALAAPNVTTVAGDAVDHILASQACSYDAILLDLDNGPTAMVTPSNHRLYGPAGLRAVHGALKKGGRVVFWSAQADTAFEARLKKVGFIVNAVPAKVHERAKRAAYMLYVAERKR